jgi:plasmid stabilization system protein ParE
MAFKVVWTRQGEESLEVVYDGLAEIDADAADRLLEGIFDTTDVLKTFPYIGARWERRGRRTPFREVQYKRYRFFTAWMTVSKQFTSCGFGTRHATSQRFRSDHQ